MQRQSWIDPDGTVRVSETTGAALEFTFFGPGDFYDTVTRRPLKEVEHILCWTLLDPAEQQYWKPISYLEVDLSVLRRVMDAARSGAKDACTQAVRLASSLGVHWNYLGCCWQVSGRGSGGKRSLPRI